MEFLHEPTEPPRYAANTAVVLCNLGTPDAPTASAVRDYLREFLSDPRVVEIPPTAWKVLLNGVILPLRSGQSAKKYRRIWTEQGSPLLLHTQRQAELLESWMHSHDCDVVVTYAMRYGTPALPDVLSGLRQQGITQILLLPMYPQYSATTTASVLDAAFSWSQQTRHVPEWRMVNRFYSHPDYIAALANSIRRHWQQHPRGEKLILSFHGIPMRNIQLGDPYAAECKHTTRLLTQALALEPHEVMMTFQSRFGKAQWLQPYTQPTVEQLAKNGVKSVDMVCPGFVADCLETLEEINIEVREAFTRKGGQHFQYIPSLNSDEEFIDALGTLCMQHLQGWSTKR